jgi:hypothetical protein
MDRSDAWAAFFAYADNYLVDVKFGVIIDVEATRAFCHTNDPNEEPMEAAEGHGSLCITMRARLISSS